jgi:hypothetical protein
MVGLGACRVGNSYGHIYVSRRVFGGKEETMTDSEPYYVPMNPKEQQAFWDRVYQEKDRRRPLTINDLNKTFEDERKASGRATWNHIYHPDEFEAKNLYGWEGWRLWWLGYTLEQIKEVVGQ